MSENGWCSNCRWWGSRALGPEERSKPGESFRLALFLCTITDDEITHAHQTCKSWENKYPAVAESSAQS